MKKSIPTLPLRLSLVDQVAQILRTGLREGRWSGHLPGERNLSAQLLVSRPTIKSAVQQLVAEGLLTNQGRFRRQILRRPRPRTARSQLVIMVSPIPLERMVPHLLLRLDYLREALAGEGLSLEVVSNRRLFSARPAAALEQIVLEKSAAVWLLIRSTHFIQRWFRARNLPVLLMGSAFEETDLCSLDYELTAVCRHAVGRFAARGHERIGFLILTPTTAGDLAGMEAFEAECAAHRPAIRPVILCHDGTNTRICKVLNANIRSGLLPQALLVSHAGACITMVSHLAQRGLRVGRDYGFISREDDPVLDFLEPAVARYRYDPADYARRALSLITKLAHGRTIARRQYRLMPKFINGPSIECRGIK